MAVGFVMTVCLSVSIEQLDSTGLIFTKFGISGIFKTVSRKFRFGKIVIITTETLDKDLCTFMIISRCFQKTQCCRDNQNRILCSLTFFFKENCAVCGIMWKNMVEPDRSRPQYNKAHEL